MNDFKKTPVAAAFAFTRARREDTHLLLGMIGASGSGKTFSALELATGLSGGKPFAFIDTESRRGLHYADRFTFDHLDLRAPFSPDNYLAAIEAADAQGYEVIVVDSMSHEWAGEGGILDWQEAELDRMAGNDYGKREACKMAAWIKPKMAHKAFVQRLLQIRAHVILCFRAEEKVEMVKETYTDRNGNEKTKTVIAPKKTATGLDGWVPVCEKSLPYELTMSLLMVATEPGVPKPIKLQEQHRDMVPLKGHVGRETGRLLAAWAKGTTPDQMLADAREKIAAAETEQALRQAYGRAYRAAPESIQPAIKDAYDARLAALKAPGEPDPAFVAAMNRAEAATPA